ncbi:MAG: radical SAM protein, partial [Planctomycetota bacterium]
LCVAAILYTYHCTIACRHCYFGCSPDRPRARMSNDRAVRCLRELHELGRVVHIAGGECMTYWDDVARILEAAHAEGVQPHFIESNCSFAVDDSVVGERLEVLRATGVRGMLLSADPFHQASVPPERFLRVRTLAREAFGPENVWCPDAPDDEVRRFAEIARDERRLGEWVRAHPPVLVGAAWRELRRFFDEYPLAELPLGTGWWTRYEAPDCAIDFAADTMWEIHVDPYDNIQTNCGVVLGDASRITPREVLQRGPGSANELTRILVTEGPFALAELARERHGLAVPESATSKCDLCYAVRRSLRPHYPDVLAPAEVYDV